MSDHKLECWATYPSDPPAWCICDELRACEQRVYQEQIAGRQHDMVLSYLRGLDAAREAVEVLLKEWWEIFEGKPEDLKELKSMVELNRAIAAIDALKEEQ